MVVPMTVLSPIEELLAFWASTTLQTALKEKITYQHKVSRTKYWSAVASSIGSKRNLKPVQALQKDKQVIKIPRKKKSESKLESSTG